MFLGTLPDFQYHRYDFLVNMLVAFDMTQQQFAAFVPLFVSLIHDGSELWRDESSRIAIGKADDSDVIGYR